MTSVRKRPLKVVTDSEDDQSDSRTRRDLQLTSKRVSTIQEEKEEKKKSSTKGYSGFSHTLPIHTITKASVLSKEAPPENYSGFLRLGSKRCSFMSCIDWSIDLVFYSACIRCKQH